MSPVIDSTLQTPPALRSAKRRYVSAVLALVGAFAIGGAVATAAFHHRVPALVMLSPAPIATMRDWSPVAVKGHVAEIFGNKFIVQDESGRALVETGPKGDGAPLVSTSEVVTIQGRFEHGFIHAQLITHADGHSDALAPAGPSPGGPAG